jgi:hypothetical protein
MGKYIIGQSLGECLVVFGIVVMAKYSISFSFHPIWMIQLVNEKYTVGLSFLNIYKYLALFAIDQKDQKDYIKASFYYIEFI